MNPTLSASFLLITLTAVVLLGRTVRRRLPEHHLMDHPLGGLIRIPSEPMLNALSQLAK